MGNEREGIEQILFRLLDYQVEQNIDHDALLIMLSLLNLMGLVNAFSPLNRDKAGALSAGGSNLQSLLPLLTLAAGGLGGGNGGGSGGQLNPAALLSLFGGMLGGNQKDLTGIFDMLGGFRGFGAPAQRAPAPKPAPKPAQREINLDRKNPTEIKREVKNVEVKREVKNVKDMQQERFSNENKVLEWKLGG